MRGLKNKFSNIKISDKKNKNPSYPKNKNFPDKKKYFSYKKNKNVKKSYLINPSFEKNS